MPDRVLAPGGRVDTGAITREQLAVQARNRARDFENLRATATTLEAAIRYEEERDFMRAVDAALTLPEQPALDEALRTAAALAPWSFKQGTLRERLEWACVQHQLGAEWLDSGHEWQPVSAEFHRACVVWYGQMVQQLDEMTAQYARLTSPTAEGES